MRVQCPKCGYVGDLPDDALTSFGGPPPVKRTLEDAVLVPLGRSGIAAGSASMVAGLLASPWQTIVAAGVLVFVAAWLLQVVPRPAMRMPSSKASVDRSTGHAWATVALRPQRIRRGVVAPGDRIRRLCVSDERLAVIFRDVMAGRRQWSSRSLYGVAGLSQSESRQLVSELLDAGLLQERDGQAHHPDGAELTSAGAAYGRRLIERYK